MQDEVTIRPARPRDANTMSALILRTLQTSNLADYGAEEIALMSGQFAPQVIVEKMQTRDVFVALEANRIIGTISLNQSKLHMLFVAPEVQGRGIGALLVRHIESHAAKKGVTSMHLSSSLTARGFYKKLNYEEVVFEKREHGSTYLMRKALV
jgi:N-acetylglutamate synthase-like GNAT family acetyltransferase